MMYSGVDRIWFDANLAIAIKNRICTTARSGEAGHECSRSIVHKGLKEREGHTIKTPSYSSKAAPMYVVQGF